ncbi:DUF4214 domain-containing protein, partial [Halomonas vilamensis]
MATQENLNLAQQLYVAYYGRPADAEGLEFWAEEIEASGAEAVVSAFGNSAEYTARFGDLSNEDLVNGIYQQAFNRDADAEGLAFYVEKLESGELGLASIALTIVQNATNTEEPDATTLATKVAAADLYTASAGDAHSGTQADDYAAEFLADIGADTDLETLDIAAVVAGIPQPQEPAEPGVPGETFNLTEGRDVLTGTDNDDTFLGLVGQNQDGAISNAFATGDYVDGGAGRDKIEASVMEDQEVESGADAAVNARTVNVEEVYFEALDLNGGEFGDTVRVDAGRMDSVDQYWSDNSSADLFIDDVRLGSKLSVTKDVTFGMRDVDTDSSLTAAFDTNSLTREGDTQSNSQLLVRVADVTTATPEAPLSNVELDIGFTVGGNDFTLESVQSTDGTYQGLQAAVEAALDDQGLGNYTVELANPYNQVTVGGNVVNLPFTAQEILVTDPDGNEFSQTSFNYNAIESVDDEFLVAGNAQPIDPATSTPLIETNLVLDNAGRGSTAGDAIIGGMSNSGQAIQKLNLVVDRDSKVDDVTSATGLSEGEATAYSAFEQIVVTSGENQGDLSIGGLTGASDIDSENLIPLDGIGNAKLFDATAFEGENLSVTGSATSEAAYVYNTAGSNDTINVAYDVVDAGSSNFSLSLDTGAGDDTVELDTNIVEPTAYSAFLDHQDLQNVQVNTGAGSDSVMIGDDGSVANVDAGAGNDFVQVSDSTAANTAQWIFNADTTGSPSGPLGQGNQQFNVFKAKLQVEFQGITSDVVDIDYSDYVTTSRNINDAIKAAIANDEQLSQLLAVSDLREEGIQVDSLVHRALSEGQLNVDFIAPTYDENTDVNTTDFGDDAATLFGDRAGVSEQELEAAWETYYPDSEGISQGSGTGIYNGVGNAADVYDALFGELDYSTGSNNLPGYNKQQTEGGANTTETTFNVIEGGSGDDMIVLSSREAGGFDTVVFEGNFGDDTVMNFNTGTNGAVNTAADQQDFTAYLDATAAGRGTSVEADERVNQKVGYSFTNGLNAGATANLAADSIDHNAVVMTGMSELFTDFAEDAADRPTSFDGITNAMVERALGENQAWVDEANASGENLVGSTFVFRLAHDQQIELDADGEPLVDDFIDAQKENVYSVTIGWDADANDGAGAYTFDANERGSIEYGDMFSTLADVESKSVTGTADATAAAEAAEEAIRVELVDEAPIDPIDPIDPPNQVPTITAETFEVAEDAADGDAVGTITASDADGSITSFTIDSGNVDVDGDDTAAFSIDSSSGEITVADADDLVADGANDPFNLSVTVTDNEGA